MYIVSRIINEIYSVKIYLRSYRGHHDATFFKQTKIQIMNQI